MQKRFGFCILFKEYIQNTNKIAKNPLSFAPKLPKIGKIGKIGCYFPAFSFFHSAYLCLYAKLVTFSAYITFLKTAHTIQLPISIVVLIIRSILWSTLRYMCTLPPFSIKGT